MVKFRTKFERLLSQSPLESGPAQKKKKKKTEEPLSSASIAKIIRLQAYMRGCLARSRAHKSKNKQHHYNLQVRSGGWNVSEIALTSRTGLLPAAERERVLERAEPDRARIPRPSCPGCGAVSHAR